MTDHLIRRLPPGDDPRAPLREIHDSERTHYRGPVDLLYPRVLPAGAAADLYTAVAQIADGAEYVSGIPRLRLAIEKWRPAEGGFYFALAEAYRKTGQAAAAIPYYAESLRRTPADLDARRNYAQALIDGGRSAEAVLLLEPAAPEDAGAWNTLGAAYLGAGRPGPSVEALRRALRIDPDLPEPYVNLGNALSRMGDLRGAAEALASAIRLQPGSAGAHNNLASILQARGEMDQAAGYFERAIQLDPDLSVAHYNYGRLLAERKDYGHAVTQLSAALQLDPRFAEAAAALGMVLRRMGRVQPAIDACRRALKIKPDLATARYNLALALLDTGDKAGAIEQLEVVVRTSPRDFEAHLRLGKRSSTLDGPSRL